MAKENIKWGEDTEGMRPGVDGRVPEGVVIITNEEYITSYKYDEEVQLHREDR